MTNSENQDGQTLQASYLI